MDFVLDKESEYDEKRIRNHEIRKLLNITIRQRLVLHNISMLSVKKKKLCNVVDL